jgi:hypothetical protein
MAFSHYSNHVESKLDVEARTTTTKYGLGLFNDLLQRASGPRSLDTPLAPDDLTRKSASSPLVNLLCIAALRAGAKGWCSNTAINAAPMTSTSQIEYHPAFPRARVLKMHGKELTDSVANLAFTSPVICRPMSSIACAPTPERSPVSRSTASRSRAKLWLLSSAMKASIVSRPSGQRAAMVPTGTPSISAPPE